MKFKEFTIMILNITAVYSATSEGFGLTHEGFFIKLHAYLTSKTLLIRLDT